LAPVARGLYQSRRYAFDIKTHVRKREKPLRFIVHPRPFDRAVRGSSVGWDCVAAINSKPPIMAVFLKKFLQVLMYYVHTIYAGDGRRDRETHRISQSFFSRKCAGLELESNGNPVFNIPKCTSGFWCPVNPANRALPSLFALANASAAPFGRMKSSGSFSKAIP